MKIDHHLPPTVAQYPISIPPLENGDRLSRAEFERRYHAMPELKKAELIEGVVYMPSPVRVRRHGKPHSHLLGWLFNYEAKTPGVESANSASARLDLDNEPQPDAILFISPENGGRIKISNDDYIEGGPEFVAEISASTVSIDRNLKLHVYRRNGVQEYLIWRVLDQQIDWFRLNDGEYQPMQPDASGILRSEVFPGLWLDVSNMLRGDLNQVLMALNAGIASAEHAAFVQRIGNRCT